MYWEGSAEGIGRRSVKPECQSVTFDSSPSHQIMADVAQLVEQDPVKVCVAGSRPVVRPKIATKEYMQCLEEHVLSKVTKRRATSLQSINYGCVFIDAGFDEVIVPAIWNEETFTDKVGTENSNMMWRFKDKGDRNVCLIPEVTGLLQETWRDTWSKQYKSRNIFYVARCYRYERPQKGRYREFTQFGIEMLGSNDTEQAIQLLRDCLNLFDVDYELDVSAKRGLSYYTTDGFEARVESLGAQKQIAGGGSYAEGVGWAIGVDRLILAENDDD